MGSRSYIRIWCDRWLTGSLKDEPIAVRGVWIGLLTLAGDGEYGDTGEIKLSNEIGLTDAQIARCLSISVALWRRCKARFCTTNRIEVGKNGSILVSNWAKYQSEYNRQKGYRGGSKRRSDSEIDAENRQRLTDFGRHHGRGERE